jgi:hypothetical protein
MELNMRVTGKMIYNMVMELRPGLMDQSTKGIIKMERNMEEVLIHGVMALNMLEIGLIIK